MDEKIKSRAGAPFKLYPPAVPADNRRLITLYHISRQITSILDLDELLARLVDQIQTSLKAKQCLILLFDEELQELRVKAARNIEGETAADAISYSRQVVDKSVEKAQAIYSHDAQREYNQIDSVHRFDIRSFICVPLRLPEKRIGAIYVDSRDVLRTFDQSDVDFLAALANFAALAIENARLHTHKEQKIVSLESAFSGRYKGIIGRSPNMSEVYLRMEKAIADPELPVLIEGETGTGKELVAEIIHSESPRGQQKLRKVDCSQIPDGNMGLSELFGHLKGAFTGAINDRMGLFEEADGGTIFLDQIESAKADIQLGLLRVLQEREIKRLGERKYRPVNIRVIAASNQNLENMIRGGKLRDDLYYRLKRFEIELPPLRERREDIPLLVDHFLAEFSRRTGKTVKGITQQAMDALICYAWPGNVRQLANELESAFTLAERGGSIPLQLFSSRITGEKGEMGPEKMGKDLVADFEKKLIQEALQRFDGNVSKVARWFGYSRQGMIKKLERWGMT